jgi:hypothetical protein
VPLVPLADTVKTLVVVLFALYVINSVPIKTVPVDGKLVESVSVILVEDAVRAAVVSVVIVVAE